MKQISVLVILMLSVVQAALSQQDIPAARNSITMVFYNVENLFDTLNDTTVIDEEFLPESPKQWDEVRYQKKLSDLAKVLSSVNKRELPSVIGLAEIENLKVLSDLANEQKLRRAKYRIVHYDSKDERGIDVALLYDPAEMELLDSKAIPVVFNSDDNDLTCDIMYIIVE